MLIECNVEGAQAHIDLSLGRISPVEDFDHQQMLEIADGEDVRQIRIGSAEYEEWLLGFERRSAWHDWFLFLHPDQESVVNEDFAGISQLSGVSGSGKTCIAVRRAMRLAKQDGARVLLLTLNRSLSGLLRQLVDAACVDENVRSRVEVISFFELARSMLLEFEPESARLYEDVTWKLEEHVDEVFREFYRRWANNDDAAPLLPLHKSMNARNVSGETYIRQEFDWIRSAVMPTARSEYLTLERRGRKFPVLAERRADVLVGLHGWEAKMRAVGVIDYLGLTSALSSHLARIEPRFTNILVDEAQDFGTTELSIIRKLVSPGMNDIFLCGDVAQTVLPKHRSMTEAGLSNLERRQIRRNYRNSRQILTAAYRLLERNLHEELFESGDLEVLDPKFANFGDCTPVALSADNLEDEINYARTYAASRLATGIRSICIAFAGFSSRDIAEYAKRCQVTALDGNYDPASDQLVFSDMEQTKGYEFDVVIVLNCCDDVLPAKDAPRDEQFRDLCRLYVAMTRAKRELLLSFHGKASDWLETVSDTIMIDDWSSVERLDPNLNGGVPTSLPDSDPNVIPEQAENSSGQTYLYSSQALGLSVEAQDKIEELVDGKGLLRAGSRRRLKWQSVQSLLIDLRETRLHDGLLGSSVADEIRAKL